MTLMGNLKPGAVSLLLAVLGSSCVSSKDRIANALDRSDSAAVEIRGEAQATDGRLGALQGLELPKEARKPIAESRASQARIVELSSDVMGANASGRKGLDGVVDRPMSWTRRLALAVGALAALLALALWLVPTGVARVLPGLVRLVWRSTTGAAKLLREQFEDDSEPTPERTKQAVAALRSNRHGEAVWRVAGR